MKREMLELREQRDGRENIKSKSWDYSPGPLRRSEDWNLWLFQCGLTKSYFNSKVITFYNSVTALNLQQEKSPQCLEKCELW